MADLTGIALKRLGGTGAISTILPYELPQAWAKAVYGHPAQVDGIYYMSRHLNDRPARGPLLTRRPQDRQGLLHAAGSGAWNRGRQACLEPDLPAALIRRQGRVTAFTSCTAVAVISGSSDTRPSSIACSTSSWMPPTTAMASSGDTVLTTPIM